MHTLCTYYTGNGMSRENHTLTNVDSDKEKWKGNVFEMNHLNNNNWSLKNVIRNGAARGKLQYLGIELKKNMKENLLQFLKYPNKP